MKKSLLTIIVCCLFIGVSSCSVNSPNASHTAHKNVTSPLYFQDFLQGKLTGWGVFEDRSGKVIKRFRIDMEANWENNQCRFIENFSFADGSKQRREWTITQTDATNFDAVANDSVGVGKGRLLGDALNWQYHLSVMTDSFGKQTVKFDYWMYKIDDNTLMNRANVTKLGIKVGEVAVLFRKKLEVSD